MQNDLFGELQRALGTEHAHVVATYSARFQLFLETLCSFFAGAQWKARDLFTPPVSAGAQNGLLGRLKQATRDARASVTHGTRFSPFFRTPHGSLAKGWIGSTRILGHSYLTWSRVCLRTNF